MLLGNVKQYVAAVKDNAQRDALYTLFSSIADRLNSVATTSAGLVIKTGGSTLAKNGTAFQGFAAGVPVTIAANTDMPALTGTITANSYNVYCFFIDSTSTVTVSRGTEATTLGAVVFPTFPDKNCLVGYLIVTHSSTFTGGTTPLDTATTVYVSPVGAIMPKIKL